MIAVAEVTRPTSDCQLGNGRKQSSPMTKASRMDQYGTPRALTRVNGRGVPAWAILASTDAAAVFAVLRRVPLPRGLSRHVVRIVRLGQRTYAVKETVEEIAFREYRLLRDLQRMGLPAVVPQGVVTGRTDACAPGLTRSCAQRISMTTLPVA